MIYYCGLFFLITSKKSMPEGPSIIILKELAMQFKGRKVLEVSGTADIPLQMLKNQVVVDFKSWGKHFLICCKKFTIRIHMMLFGSYRINERKSSKPKLGLRFSNGEINFYACLVTVIEEDLDEVYDWSADVMNKTWSPAKAKKKILQDPDRMVCDILMDQSIFSGVGNIIKNEVLYRIKVHPESKACGLPPAKIKALLQESVDYSFEFLHWKKQGVLKKNWKAYHKKICGRDGTAFTRKDTGRSRRTTFFCKTCQRLYLAVGADC